MLDSKEEALLIDCVCYGTKIDVCDSVSVAHSFFGLGTGASLTCEVGCEGSCMMTYDPNPSRQCGAEEWDG